MINYDYRIWLHFRDFSKQSLTSWDAKADIYWKTRSMETANLGSTCYVVDNIDYVNILYNDVTTCQTNMVSLFHC